MGGVVQIGFPAVLAEHHDLSRFDCGEPSLNEWLRKRAQENQASGASRTFVLCQGAQVLAFYALAAGEVRVKDAPGRFRRKMPDPVPVVLLGRLAVDLRLRGKGIGRALVRDATRRVLNAAETIGIRGIAVRAISFDARAFYLALGFTPCPHEPLLMVITLADARKALGQ
jgi:predicted N-acetyltransferase YhbS